MNNKIFLQNKLIVITRPEPENEILEKKLKQYGAIVYNFPTIKITENTFQENVLKNLSHFDWIIFTSVKGVDFFIRTLKRLDIDKNFIKNKKIAVVGPKTAEAVHSYNLSVNFMPTKYTTKQLSKEIEGISDKKLLLPRSNIASKQFVKDLELKGALITNIPIYKTTYLNTPDSVFEDLIKNNKVNYLTFTSPSTVIGFFERISTSKIKDKVRVIPALSIGPVTTKTAEKYGFKHIFTADKYTTNGMIKKLQEIV